MSKKNLNQQGRWRSVTIAFRVSPEENEDIEHRVCLSGLTKQDYITRRCQERDVVVTVNPRVHKALREEIQKINTELERIEAGSSVNDALKERIWLVKEIYEGMDPGRTR